MRELIKNAQFGWLQYTSNGKMAALLLVALLFLWFGQKAIREKYRTLILYTTIMTIVCICPFTAMLLMKYQTKFYDYQWIWNTVPVTAVIALAVTNFWLSIMEKYGNNHRNEWKKIGITFVLVAIVCISGGMKKNIEVAKTDKEDVKAAGMILEKISETGQIRECSIWAPKEIMEWVRSLNGEVNLPYGRNMWDEALNAYCYDIYGKQEEVLYKWMCSVEEADEIEDVNNGECLALARELGVTHMVLPEKTEPEVLKAVEEVLEEKGSLVGEYYLYCLQ